MSEFIRRIIYDSELQWDLARRPLQTAADEGWITDVDRVCSFLRVDRSEVADVDGLRQSLRLRLTQIAVGKWM